MGATTTDLFLIYENEKTFQPLPTFGAIPFFNSDIVNFNKTLVPNVDLSKVLPGEHYLEIMQPLIPKSCCFISTRTSVEVIEKGSSAVTITGYTTHDAASGVEIFYNELTFILRWAGVSDGSKEPKSGVRCSRSYQTPPMTATGEERQLDAVETFKTSENQAALYRLSGDRERIHIDPEFARRGGHAKPILHGNCTMGIAGLHLFRTFGPFRSMKVRFVGVVIPGQTLRTEMWRDLRESDLVLFQVRVVETGRLCILGCGIHLLGAESRSIKL